MTLFESVTSAQPCVFNTPTPPDLADFRNLPEYKRRDIEQKREFFRQDHIKNFLDKKNECESHNKIAIEWLCRYRDENMTPEEEHAINTQLNRFLQVIGDQKNIHPVNRIDVLKLKLNFWKPKQQNNDGAWPG
mgnify:CR=1 FL=1